VTSAPAGDRPCESSTTFDRQAAAGDSKVGPIGPRPRPRGRGARGLVRKAAHSSGGRGCAGGTWPLSRM
jgi:hypothetical protein